jgi:hypothetical protein
MGDRKAAYVVLVGRCGKNQLDDPGIVRYIKLIFLK